LFCFAIASLCKAETCPMKLCFSLLYRLLDTQEMQANKQNHNLPVTTAVSFNKKKKKPKQKEKRS